jgi:hypothetical protein
VKFVWQKVTGATSYRVIFSTKQNFENYDAIKKKCNDNLSCFSYSVTTPSYNLSSASKILSTKAVYFWRVQAISKNNVGDMSNIRLFMVSKDPVNYALNDTGILECFDGNDFVTCPSTNYPNQDSDFGKDKLSNNNQNEYGGFNFSKLDSQGKKLPLNASIWQCVMDNTTGLVWEIKNLGDHDINDLYTWYEPDDKKNGKNMGKESVGKDTNSYIKTINNEKYCGYKDWRLPSLQELLGIVAFNHSPSINEQFFNDIILKDSDSYKMYFWTSSSYIDSNFAGFIDFYKGKSGWMEKSYKNHIRLVRG